MHLRLFDNTRLRAYKGCPRKFYFRHVRHWTSDRVSSALAFGGAWHSGMDEIWVGNSIEDAMVAWAKSMMDNGIDPTEIHLDDLRNAGVAKAMFTEYDRINGQFMADSEVLEVEQPFAVPLGETDQYFYVGRVDKRIRRKGRIHFIEHKTTTAYKKDGPFRSTFIESFSPNSQIDGYNYAGHLLYGKEFKSVLVDAALVHKTVHNGFRFYPQERMFAMLDQFLSDATYWSECINDQLKVLAIEAVAGPGDYLKAFPKNTESCSIYAGCSYKDICRFMPNPEKVPDPPKGYVVSKWEPYDFLRLGSIGMEKEGGTRCPTHLT